MFSRELASSGRLEAVHTAVKKSKTTDNFLSVFDQATPHGRLDDLCNCNGGDPWFFDNGGIYR